MKKKNLNKISLVVIISGMTLMIIVLIFFWLNFKDQVISNKIESWAQFGDYFGGVLNPLLALVNICVFIILSVKIQELTDSNNDKSLNESKKIAIMSMKYEELKHFKKTMDKSLETWKVDKSSYAHFESVQINYFHLEKRMLFLFPELEKSNNNISLKSYIIDAFANKNKSYNSKEVLKFYNDILISYTMLLSDLEKWTLS